MTLQITSCEAKRNFHTLSIIKNKFRSSVLEKRLNYLYILYLESYITIPLSYDEAIKEQVPNICRKKGTIEVCQTVVNKHIILFFWIL
jgi:hypothetical protein